MRSLFHFPFPAQPPSQQPSPTATVSLQSEMCHRPHPAPMRRQRRSPVLLSAARPLPGPALTGPWPTVTRSQGARHAAPPSLPRAAARSHRAPSPEYRPAVPAPIGLASSASRPSRAVARIASTPLRAAIRIPLCRHRADSALIAPPSRPSCAAIRIAPPSLSSRCGGPRALFRVEEPEITHGAKMLPAPPGLSAAAACGPAERALRHAAAACGPAERALRHAAAACGPAGRALRPAAQAWPACRMRPPVISLMPAAACGPAGRASPSETRHAVPVPTHLATCAPHPSRQPRGPTASRKQAEQRKQLNAGIKIGSPNRDPIEELFGFAQRLPDALQPLHQANELALSYLDHSTRQRLGGYVIGLSGNSFTVDLYAALVDHATSIAC